MLWGEQPDVRWLFAREVKRLNYLLVEAKDAQRAREILAEGRVALAIIEDQERSDESLELVHFIRKEFPATEVILYTSCASPQRAFAFGSLQVAAYLVKPFMDQGPLDLLFSAAVSRYKKRTTEDTDQERIGLRMKALAKLVDRMPMGIVLVDSRRLVLLCNQMARTILDEADGLKVGEGHLLEANRPEDTITLQRLVEAALPEAVSGGFPTGGATTIGRSEERPPLCLMVGPLDVALEKVESDDPVVAVIITDPQHELAPREKILCRLYGLAPQQVRLAVKLMQGKSINAASQEMQISVNTAKSHRREVYARTGTSTQAELVSLLWSSPATIRLGRAARSKKKGS